MPGRVPVAADAAVIKSGHHIFVYSHIRSKQVIYSLTRSLNNHTSLKQLPFLGKKTVPASIRKDLWQPLALIEFPHPLLGLSAFRKLREYRRLHETQYPLEDITETEGPKKGHLFPKKKRGFFLMDQKANSVADVAAVLLQAEKGPSEEQIAAAKRRLRSDGRPPAKIGVGAQTKSEVLEVVGKGVEGVRIRWANILDAEYAETWPAAVVHDTLAQSRYTAAFPVGPAIPGEQSQSVDGESGKSVVGRTRGRDGGEGGETAIDEPKKERKPRIWERILPRRKPDVAVA
ncbi:MAG: hypothetical protein MMC33_008401 [Icmadophila ericetorum]|nr:hypothetical protein [Icmadophila ericetorum]